MEKCFQREKRKVLFLTIVMVLLVSSVNVFAQDNNIKDLPSDVKFDSGAIVGYDGNMVFLVW